MIAQDWDHYYKMVEEDILDADTHIMLGGLDDYDRAFGKFHVSKEIIEGVSAGGGDILNKKWSLTEEYSYHLLLFQQVKSPFLANEIKYSICLSYITNRYSSSFSSFIEHTSRIINPYVVLI